MHTPTTSRLAPVATGLVGLALLAGCQGPEQGVQAPAPTAVSPGVTTGQEGVSPSAEPARSSGVVTPSGAPTPTVPAPAASTTAGASTSSSGSATPVASGQASRATATSVAPKSTQPVSGPVVLPEQFNGWTKVEQDDQSPWLVGAYGNDAGLVLEVRAARTSQPPQQVLAELVGGTITSQGSAFCGQRAKSASRPAASACVRRTEPATVVIVSPDLETEEIAPLLPLLLEAMG